MPHKSLELDAGASLFQLSLGLLGIFLLGLLEDGLRSAVDKSLGLGQAEVGDGADSLDDLDLLVADGGEDDVELILLFFSRSSSASNSGNSGNRSGSLDVELLLEGLTNSESSTRVISPKASSSSSLVYLAIMASFQSWRRTKW